MSTDREPTTRERVRRAFAHLRRQGFVARMSYQCCGTCAAAALDVPENRGKPCVYYNRQTAEAWDRKTGELKWGLYLSYGIIGPDQGEQTAAVGHQIIGALRDEGLSVSWNGSPGQCIQVMPRLIETVATGLSRSEVGERIEDLRSCHIDAASFEDADGAWSIRVSPAQKDEAQRRLRWAARFAAPV